MSIQKISFYGAKVIAPAAVETPDELTIVKSFTVGITTRGDVIENQVIELQDDELVEFMFDDSTTWICNSDTIEEVFPEAANPSRSGDGSFELPQVLRSRTTERGIVGDILLKLVTIFTKKAIAKGINELAKDLEKKALDNQSGLYRIDSQFNLSSFQPQSSSDKPYLLFLHGTGSSTRGSFAELMNTKVWADITTIYGSNILGFQHESLSKSPLQNAVELVEKLPAVSELHIVSHSRGGLIGDILSRFCNSNEGKRGFDADEMTYLNTTSRNEDKNNIAALQKILSGKTITISRFIRVACPANGTILASKRLDYFFNILLNLIGLGTGAAANPLYGAFKNLIAAVIDTKNDNTSLPGIEAMNPESPFIKVLNRSESEIVIDNPLMVISGNCKASFNLKALLIITSKLFYFTDNDLIVNTLSMYAGSRRDSQLKYLFDEADNVDHFHYFKNERTSNALLAALKNDGDIISAGFKTEDQTLLEQGERGLEGGEIYTNQVSGTRPIVVLLPGIMGSNLALDNKSLWINYWNFLKGGLRDLKIENTGITAPSLVGTSYRRLVRYLQNSYDVVTFPFDWRLPLTDAADLFNTKIVELLQYRQPIKIIGHSMGGVLVRDFILKHDDTWQTLNQSNNFRLIFLGAPLGGSFRIPAVLFGQDPIIDKLSKIDIVHTKKDLLKIFSKMPGLLSLLPVTNDKDNDFAKAATWSRMIAGLDKDWPLPVVDNTDMVWFQSYRDNVITKLDNIDFSNAVYIAGKDKATPCGYRIDDTKNGDKQLVFLSTAEGDQSVTWESGIPKKMISQNAVYYVQVSHGALANEPAIFDGIADILAKGNTNKLNKNRPVVRGEEKVFVSPDRQDFDLSKTGVEKTLLGLDTQPGDNTQSKTPLQVSVSNGHLKYANFPVLAGHFSGDGILYAESEIDKMLKGALAERHRIGLYPGELGSSEVILSGTDKLKGGIIVGLGKFNELTAFGLTKTVEQGICRYILDINNKLSAKNNMAGASKPLGVSALVIGSGYGGLSIESSIRAVLQGVENANAKLLNINSGVLKLIEQIEFIELYEDRALSCFYTISKLEQDENETLKINISSKNFTKTYGAKRRISSESSEAWWNRITVTLDENSAADFQQMEFSVYTGAAREEKKSLFINPAGIQSMISDSSVGNQWTPKLAKTLFEILIPLDFKEQLKRQGNINWILDENTAAYPWELLQDNIENAKPLSVNAGMIRQLGTKDFRLQVSTIASDKALVVGEPQLDGFLPELPGASAEGEAVAAILGQNDYSVTPLLKSNARDILQELHSGYKIIHLAGHGVFNKDSPQHSGMVIGKNLFLTSADISNMSIVPELVFVNCCNLGRTDGDAETFYRNAYKVAANIGTQLIANGVRAVVVAGWAVNDAAALQFAQTFYENMFEGDCFGDAVRKARASIYETYKDTTNTWGAYQCYGDPFYKFRIKTNSKKTVAKNFVLAEEAVMDLDNLRSLVKAGDLSEQAIEEELEATSMAVDKAGIRQADITELEALLYADIYRYDLAIAKFGRLLSTEKADFSVSSLEKYCNIRMKKYAADYIDAVMNNKADVAKNLKVWQSNAQEAINGLESLLLISDTAERYNLLGSAYKRFGILSTGKAKKLQAYRRAAYYYYKANEKGVVYNNAYALTNLYALESVLVLAGDRKWDEEVKTGTENFKLSSKKEALKRLQDKIDGNASLSNNMNYWELVEVPNCKLCLLFVSPALNDTGKWDDVLNAYLEVWNNAGSKSDKLAEIEHLKIMSDAVSISDKDTTKLKGKIDNLIANLLKML